MPAIVLLVQILQTYGNSLIRRILIVTLMKGGSPCPPLYIIFSFKVMPQLS